jgi:hypothetical protein
MRFRSFRAKLSRIADCYTSAQKGQLGYRAKFSETRAGGQSDYLVSLLLWAVSANSGRLRLPTSLRKAVIGAAASRRTKIWCGMTLLFSGKMQLLYRTVGPLRKELRLHADSQQHEPWAALAHRRSMTRGQVTG